MCSGSSLIVGFLWIVFSGISLNSKWSTNSLEFDSPDTVSSIVLLVSTDLSVFFVSLFSSSKIEDIVDESFFNISFKKYW